MPAFTMNDVDDNVVAVFKKLAAKKGRIDSSLLDEPKEVLLDRLHLVNGNYLTNAAMLLFSKDPERYQLGAFLKIGYFETDADLLYQDEIHGSLLEQVDKAIELIYLKNLNLQTGPVFCDSHGLSCEKHHDISPLYEYIWRFL